MEQIRFNEPYLTGKEFEYISDVFKQKQFYGNGKYTKLSTELIQNRLRSQNVLLTDSCTSALEMTALLIRDFEKVQEVILPSYTFSSTASAFARAGFKIVFAEIDPVTMMLDLEDAKSKVTEFTAAIVIVHYGGYCAEVEAALQICRDNGIFLVEDAAQAFGCSIEDRPIGTIGDFGCYSFHETKNIHAGLSGALHVKDEDLFTRASYIWERGTNRQDVLKGLVNKYSWVEIGGSFYPTELQAAFLFAQLEQFDNNITERKQIYSEYDNVLNELRENGLVDYPAMQNGYTPNYHAFFLIFSSEKVADLVRETLVSSGFHAYIGYIPLHSSPVGKKLGYSESSLPITEEFAKRVLRLPFHNNMSQGQATCVAETIKGVLGG